MYNLKNVKNTHGGVLTLVHECFSQFLNCTNATKFRNAANILGVIAGVFTWIWMVSDQLELDLGRFWLVVGGFE